MINTLGYIDPASTALIWQVLAGILISLGVVFGVWWRKITTFFKTIWVKLFRRNKAGEVEKKQVDESMLEVEDVDTSASKEAKKDAPITETTSEENDTLGKTGTENK